VPTSIIGRERAMKIFLSFLVIFSLSQGGPQERPSYAIMYFFNPDCPSCKSISPFIDYLKEEYNVVIYPYNTRNPVGMRYGMQHRIRYVPTMIISIGEGDSQEDKRFEGADQIREAEILIADLAGKQVQHSYDKK
jgi:thiol-disulfide isomerase/thioredoxin